MRTLPAAYDEQGNGIQPEADVGQSPPMEHDRNYPDGTVFREPIRYMTDVPRLETKWPAPIIVGRHALALRTGDPNVNPRKGKLTTDLHAGDGDERRRYS